MNIIFIIPILSSIIMTLFIVFSHQGIAQGFAQLIFWTLILETIVYTLNLKSGKDT